MAEAVLHLSKQHLLKVAPSFEARKIKVKKLFQKVFSLH